MTPNQDNQSASTTEVAKMSSKGDDETTSLNPATSVERYGLSAETPHHTMIDHSDISTPQTDVGSLFDIPTPQPDVGPDDERGLHRVMVDRRDDINNPNTPDMSPAGAPMYAIHECKQIEVAQHPTPQTDVGSDDERGYLESLANLANSRKTELQTMHENVDLRPSADMDPIHGLQYSSHEPSRIQSQKSLIKGIYPEPSASNTPSSIVPDNTTVQGIQYDASGWGGPSTPQGPYVSTPKSNIWPSRLAETPSDTEESEAEPEATPVPTLPLSQPTQPTHNQSLSSRYQTWLQGQNRRLGLDIPVWPSRPAETPSDTEESAAERQNQIGLHPRQRPRNDQDNANDPWAQEDPPDKGTPPDEPSHK